MRLALVNLACESDLARADIFSYMPPLGIMYLAKWLRMCKIPGLEIRVFDEKEGGLEPFDMFWQWQQHIVAVGLWRATFDRALEMAAEYKRIYPDTYIVGGGPMTGALSSAPPGFDCIVKGVGYGALEAVARGERPKGVVTGGLTEPKLILPDEAYGYRIGALMAAYGCPYKCHFCESRRLKHFEFRPRNCVEIEIERLVNAPAVPYFEFFDNIFFIHPEIEKFIKRIGGRKPWGAILDCRRKRGEMVRIERAVDNGLLTLGLGIESLDPEVLSGINKHHLDTDVKQTVRALRPMRKRGLRVHAFMMYGLPRQTMVSVNRDRDWLERMGVPAQWSRLKVIPGTWLSRHQKRMGLEVREDYTVERTKWMSGCQLDRFERYAAVVGPKTQQKIWGDIFAKVRDKKPC